MKKIIYTIIAIAASIVTGSAQTIPNNGFETWTSMGSYNNPDSWASPNDMTSTMSTYTCVKGTPGNVGAAYIKLTSKTVTGLGVVPGIAVCGQVDMATFQPTSGFPITGRPQNLTGKWQYMATGADQGFIACALTKWNTGTMMRDTIAACYHALPGMAMSWANFTIPLNYMSGDDPDSCIIVLSASRANGVASVATSYLYVDEMLFSGTVLSANSSIDNSLIQITPNPVNERMSINIGDSKSKIKSIEIFDINGRLMRNVEVVSADKTMSIDLSSFSTGKYFVNLRTDDSVIIRQIIKN